MEKSNFNHCLLLALFMLWLPLLSSAQITVNMAANGPTAGTPFMILPPGNCSFNFFDSGGPSGNYNLGANAYVTFVPSNPTTHRIQIAFLTFGLEEGWDALYIYNSTSVGVNQVPGPQGITLSGFPGGNWQSISPGVVRANFGLAAVGNNPDEALTVQFRSDATNTAAGWAAVVVEVPKNACQLTPPPNLTVNTGPASTSCFVSVNTPLPSYSPGGCNSGSQLRYRLNGGSPVVVTDIGSTQIPAPKGQNVVVWELLDLCGGGVYSSGVQTITVIDNTAPTLGCPANLTFYLQGGQCASFVNYNVSLSDNCSFMQPQTVSHPIDFDNGQAGVMFNVSNLSLVPITITEFGPSLDVGTWPMEVYVTSSASSWVGQQNNAAAWSLLASPTVTSASPGAGTPVGGFSLTLAPGESKGIYLTSKSGFPVNFTGTGAGISRQYDDGSLRVSSAPGAGVAYPFGTATQSRAYNGYVKYAANTTGLPVQVGGLPSGSAFPLGTTVNTFMGTDAAGNSTVCSFSVTVKEYPNPLWSLTCNDLSYVALGDGCTTTLNADQILEGGPYKCYDYYVVEIDRTLPLGNGPWQPAILTSADIGKTYTVRVLDPVTGNKCQGDIKVQDNLAPQLQCSVLPTFLPCSFPSDPGFAKYVTVNQRFAATGLPLSVVDNQTRTIEIPVSGPADLKVNDLDLRVRISGDAFAFNLRIWVESPGGTVVTVWDEFGGCGNLPLWVRFDDEGLGGVPQCPDLTTDKKVAPPFLIGQLSAFDQQNPNGTWKVHIRDVDAGGNLSSIETVELHLNMSGTYSAGFPGVPSQAPVVALGNNTFRVPAGLLDLCSDVTLSFTQTETKEDCKTGFASTIQRRWLARDASGNTSVCVQQIKVLSPSFQDVSLPPDYHSNSGNAFSCQGVYPSPDWIEAQGSQGWPQLYGLPEACSVSWSYEDQVTSVCDGSYTIVRRWRFLDLCDAVKVHFHNQVIQVLDDEGPSIDCPANLTATTDPFSCCATVQLPSALLDDDCSKVQDIGAAVYIIDPYTQDTTNILLYKGHLSNFPGNNTADHDTLGVLGTTGCLPIGDHRVVYSATDQCGNVGTCAFTLSVRDYSPPVVSCDDYTVVAIGVDDPADCYLPSANGCDFAGVTWLRASTLDDGSHDNCGKLRFRARRVAPFSDCILGLNKVNGHPDCGDGSPDALSEFDLATSEGDSLKFYCCEVGTVQTVILRAYQLEADGSISLYPDGTPIFNECSVKVEVQDKLKPQCDPPLNITVQCANFDPSLWAHGMPKVYDNCCLDSTKIYQGQKGLTHSANYSQFDSLCNRGTIVRTFRVFDCHGQSGQCTQRIIVAPDQTSGYAIRFPDDVAVNSCGTNGTAFGEPVFSGKDCELLGVSYEDQVFNVVPDACFKIERTWTIINWCTYDPNAGCTDVPNPNPNSLPSHPTNLVGPTVSPAGTPAPWAPTVVKISPGDAAATSFSKYWSATANCYRYKQIIKVTDTEKPELFAPSGLIEVCDQTANDPKLWNTPEWWDAKLETHDLCEMPLDLSVTGTDACSGSQVSIRYLLFLDLDGDNLMETVVNSNNPPAAGTVQYSNASQPNYIGGYTRAFDQRAVATGDKYRFAIETSAVGKSLTARVRWNTDNAPGTYINPELPHGTHKIKWIISDNCGNETVKEYSFTVRDCKAPSVVCINGLSANVMTNGITLFASDFLLFATDNCSPQDKLRFGLRKKGSGTGFPLDASGNPQISVTFGCNEIGAQLVELWAIDMAGNADYCEATVVIQDNLGNCTTNATIAGALQTEAAQGLEEAHVQVSGQNPAGPSLNQMGMTDKTGHFKFSNAIPMASDFTVTPVKDDNPLNGVSTYDLVLISKHILGLETLNTPYKMIAADANRSGSITTYDIVELRKLILGIYTELPNNSSWRFVDKQFVFLDPSNPFKVQWPENKTYAAIKGSQMQEDFVAIKVGDLNQSVMANSLSSTEERSEGTWLMDVLTDHRFPSVNAGEDVEVKFRPTPGVQGYQFTLHHPDLQVLEVLPGEGMGTEHFGVLPAEHALTVSWNGSQGGDFRVRFRALRAGLLSELMQVSSRITRAEAYPLAQTGAAAPKKQNVALRFSDGTVSGVAFELYQNAPNPFMQHTSIGFYLPEAATATLTVYDEMGRLLLTQKGDYAAGYNAISLERGKWAGSSGLLIYKLETDTHHSATRKMTVLEK